MKQNPDAYMAYLNRSPLEINQKPTEKDDDIKNQEDQNQQNERKPRCRNGFS